MFDHLNEKGYGEECNFSIKYYGFIESVHNSKT